MFFYLRAAEEVAGAQPYRILSIPLQKILEGEQEGVQRSKNNDSSLFGRHDAPRLLSVHSNDVPLPSPRDGNQIASEFLRAGGHARSLRAAEFPSLCSVRGYWKERRVSEGNLVG